MHRTLTILCFAAVAMALAAAVQEAEKAPVFNGKNLAGWTFRGRTPDAENPFYVEDGSLCCKGQPVGYLRTNEKYTSYTFRVEWRWPEGSKPGNNGVLLGVQDGEHFFSNTWPKSIEAQLAHHHAGEILTIGDFPLQTGRNQGRRTATLKPSSEKPPGQWNQFEATLQDGRLKLIINGELQNEATDVAKTSGYIALQSEGAPIEFRNIRLTVLDE